MTTRGTVYINRAATHGDSSISGVGRASNGSLQAVGSARYGNSASRHGNCGVSACSGLGGAHGSLARRSAGRDGSEALQVDHYIVGGCCRAGNIHGRYIDRASHVKCTSAAIVDVERDAIDIGIDDVVVGARGIGAGGTVDRAIRPHIGTALIGREGRTCHKTSEDRNRDTSQQAGGAIGHLALPLGYTSAAN